MEEFEVEEVDVTGREAKATRGARRQNAGRMAVAAAVAVTRERLDLVMVCFGGLVVACLWCCDDVVVEK